MYDINKTDDRLAFFLGQCAIESAYFRTLKEMGGIAYFEKAYGKKVGIPPKDKTKRKNLKYWYIGRGLIQTTWDFNYKKVQDATGIECVSQPWLLEETEYAVKSAVIFWKNNKLNDFADANDIRGATKKINGGYNHLKERTEYIKRFQQVLAGDDIEGLPPAKILSKSEVKNVQAKLKEAGYHEVGIPNGEIGSRTVAALAAFKSDNGLPVNDDIDDETLLALDDAPEREISEDRANGVPEDDESTTSAKRTMQAGAAGVGVMGVPQVLSFIEPVLEKTEETQGIVERITDIYHPVKSLIASNPEIFVGAAFLIVFYFGYKAYKGIVRDFRQGSKF